MDKHFTVKIRDYTFSFIQDKDYYRIEWYKRPSAIDKCDYTFGHDKTAVSLFFKLLGINDPNKFLTDVYGYEPITNGIWPYWKVGDTEAPIKVREAIMKLVNGDLLEDEEFLLL